MKDETKEIKEGFEFIIRNQEGKEIFRETFEQVCEGSFL